jgi:hypothetical protein
LLDGNWHSVSVYGSLSTNVINSCVTVYVDGIPINWDKLTKTVIASNGTRGSPVVLAGPGTNITGCATLPDYGDFRPRFGAYAYDKFGSINFFQMFLDNLAILTDKVYYVAPTLAAITNYSLIAGATLVVTNNAVDPNLPPQSLGFYLATKPSGATINGTNGLITWRPAMAQAGSTNQFVVVVTNAPGLSATQSFWAGVVPPAVPVLTPLPSPAGVFRMNVTGSPGPDYLIQTRTNLAVGTWATLQSTNPAQLPFTFETSMGASVPIQFYRVVLGP